MIHNTNFLHLITDYGVGDPAFGEVIQKLKLLSPNLEIYPTSVPAFSTLATGFWIGQYALVNSWPGLTIFSNTAPRDLPGTRSRNEGEPFVYAQLNNGVHVCAVNAGYSLSFVKPLIKQLNKLKVRENGSQFRSRDFYPEAVVSIIKVNMPSESTSSSRHSEATTKSPSFPVAEKSHRQFMIHHGLTKLPRDPSSSSVPPLGTHYTAHLQNLLGPALDPASVPDIPSNKLAFIDGYGNIKTTIRAFSLHPSSSRHSEATTKPPSFPVAEESHRRSMINHGPTVGTRHGTYLQPGQLVSVTINGITQTATYSGGIFEVPTGQLAFAPGSSGGDDPFMEIIYRTNIENGSSAAQKFHHPPVEAEIILQI
jgi:hypothetical protein